MTIRTAAALTLAAAALALPACHSSHGVTTRGHGGYRATTTLHHDLTRNTVPNDVASVASAPVAPRSFTDGIAARPRHTVTPAPRISSVAPRGEATFWH